MGVVEHALISLAIINSRRIRAKDGSFGKHRRCAVATEPVSSRDVAGAGCHNKFSVVSGMFPL